MRNFLIILAVLAVLYRLSGTALSQTTIKKNAFGGYDIKAGSNNSKKNGKRLRTESKKDKAALFLKRHLQSAPRALVYISQPCYNIP